MAFTVDELNPSKPMAVIGDYEVEFNLLSLRITVRINELYESLEKCIKVINEKPLELLPISWMLLADKELFNNKYVSYVEYIQTHETSLNWATKLSTAVYACITRSMPLIKNKKREDELRKIMDASGDAKEVCYAEYYDTLANRYGYTLEDFYDLTLRAIHILLTTCSDKSYEDLEIQAALQGKKLEPRMKQIEIDEKKDEEMDKEAEEMLARLKQNYKAVNDG